MKNKETTYKRTLRSLRHPLTNSIRRKLNELSDEKGNYIQGDPEDGFSPSYPFVPPPPSGPLRHSGASRNPEDPFP